MKHNPFRQPLRVKSITWPYSMLPPKFVGLQKGMDEVTNECPTFVTVLGPDGTGPMYQITQLAYIERAVARKAGGRGVLYHVQFNGQWQDIFKDANGEWFMESEVPILRGEEIEPA